MFHIESKTHMPVIISEIVVLCILMVTPVFGQVKEVSFSTRNIPEIGKDSTRLNGVGIVRRDPSDVIKLDDTYYVFYARSIHSDWPQYGWKGNTSLGSGYYGTIWYATSPDGLKWTERGEALGRGEKDKLDSNGVFSPNIIRAPDGKAYIYYTAVPTGFKNNNTTDYTYIFGAELVFDKEGAISEARRLNNGDPVLSPTTGITHDNKSLFDSYRVDDSSMVWRDFDADGRLELGLYYKGRAEAGTPGQTKMGLAISDSPGGPFTRHACSTGGNVAQNAGHEVMIFAFSDGISSLVSNVGHGIYYASEGTNFAKTANFSGKIYAPGAFRPELTDATYSGGVDWGISMVHNGNMPYLVRWDAKGLKSAPSATLKMNPKGAFKAK